jgi:hypothetical protein
MTPERRPSETTDPRKLTMKALRIKRDEAVDAIEKAPDEFLMACQRFHALQAEIKRRLPK